MKIRLTQGVAGGQVGDTVDVSDEWGKWYLAQGYAVKAPSQSATPTDQGRSASDSTSDQAQDQSATPSGGQGGQSSTSSNSTAQSKGQGTGKGQHSSSKSTKNTSSK